MLSTIKNLAKRLNPYHRYERCHCLTLYRFGRRKAELCYAPADYEPREHVHPNSDGEFLILWAKNRPIYRKVIYDPNDWNTLGKTGARVDSYLANVPPWKFKTLSVRAGVPHAFRAGDSCMIWLCFEKWKPGTKVTSVAEDLVLT